MNYIEPIYKEVVNIKSMIDEIVDREVYNNEAKIRETISKRWLMGKDSNGNLIGLYSGESYAEYKYGLNKQAGFGNVDLTLSGTMARSIEISGFNGEYEIFSRVGYYSDIVERYGEMSFNLTDEERDILFNQIWNVIFNELNEAYG